MVAVYETAIKPVMKQAMAHPWAILMEKPVGLDLDDAQDIAAAAKANHPGVRRASTAAACRARRRCWPTSPTIRRRASSMCRTSRASMSARQIGHAEPVVRNWMYANSIHLVDYLRTFGRGEVSEVTPIARWNPQSPGVVLAKVTFASGDVGLYEGIWNGPGPWACTVTTPRRRWEMRPLEKAVFQNAGERKLMPVEWHAWDEAFKPGFRLQAERVANARARAGRRRGNAR